MHWFECQSTFQHLYIHLVFQHISRISFYIPSDTTYLWAYICICVTLMNKKCVCHIHAHVSQTNPGFPKWRANFMFECYCLADICDVSFPLVNQIYRPVHYIIMYFSFHLYGPTLLWKNGRHFVFTLYGEISASRSASFS